MFSFRYPNLETFAVDVRLVFDNCETFNEDDSDIGRAGHNMRKYFEKKWTDIFKVSWSYNNLFFLLNEDKWDQQCELYLDKCARHIHNDFFFLKISITKKKYQKNDTIFKGFTPTTTKALGYWFVWFISWFR